MTLFIQLFKEIWGVTTSMAPYLLFGFFMAGLLSAFISKETVRRHLGGTGWAPTFKAALFGVPMPICSCGIIPLAASLRKQGASRGATASFLASTPQTGIDSLLVTYALLGWIYAVIRAIIAFISGILCGAAVNRISHDDETHFDSTFIESNKFSQHPIRKMLSYGFITLPRNVAPAIVLGIMISGTISTFVPSHQLEQFGSSPYALFVMLIVGIPIYVCSSASVPIALAFINAGISPGAALVFLITGPATNAATLTTLWGILGRKQLVVFLITLCFTALTAGFLLDLLDPAVGISNQINHQHQPSNSMNTVFAVVLLVLLIKAILPLPDKTKLKSNCNT